jgi:hypothetical protein
VPTCTHLNLQTLPDDDLDETPITAPRHHLSHQQSSSSATLPTTMPCRLLRVPPPSMITRRLADAGVLALFTRSLRRPTIARPEALSWVVSPGQAQLQIFNLALISIVGIRSWINHMKLNEHTRRLLLSPSVRIARSKLFSLFLVFSFFPGVTNSRHGCPFICVQGSTKPTTSRPKTTRTQLSNLLQLGLTQEPSSSTTSTTRPAD